MKRGSKLFFRAPGCPDFGPLPWTKVREWVSFGYLLPSDEMRVVGEDSWVAISSDPDVSSPKGGFIRELTDDYSKSIAKKESVGPRASKYLQVLGCPIPLNRLNRYTARWWAQTLETYFPDRANETEMWATKSEAFGETPTELPTDPTPKQIAYLRGIGIKLPPGSTRRDASRLIGGDATEGQIRRLKFFGIYEDKLSKEEATGLISKHLQEHPESEAAYQAVRDKLVASIPAHGAQSSYQSPKSPPKASNRGAELFLLALVVLAVSAVLAYIGR